MTKFCVLTLNQQFYNSVKQQLFLLSLSLSTHDIFYLVDVTIKDQFSILQNQYIVDVVVKQ